METNMKPSSKTLYLNFINSMTVNSNGFLVVNNETRTIDLIPYKLEKYHLNNGIGSTIRIVSYSSDERDLNKSQGIVKINLDSEYHIVDYDYNVQKATLENILTQNIGEKLTGIYAGIFERSKKAILNYSEAGTFMLINNALERIEKLETLESMANSEKELTNIREEKRNWEYGLDFCLAHLSRFGVTQKYNSETDRMEQTPTFKAWFSWWGDYFQTILGNNNQGKKDESPVKSDDELYFEQCLINYQVNKRKTAQVNTKDTNNSIPTIKKAVLKKNSDSVKDEHEEVLFQVFVQCQRTGQDYGLFKPQGSFLDYMKNDEDKVVLKKEMPLKSLSFSKVKVS